MRYVGNHSSSRTTASVRCGSPHVTPKGKTHDTIHPEIEGHRLSWTLVDLSCRFVDGEPEEEIESFGDAIHGLSAKP